MRMPSFLLQHTVQVEAYLGASSKGDLYAAPQQVQCLLEEKTQIVISPGGEQVTSSSMYRTRLDHDPPPKSRVTLSGGRVTKVIVVARPNGGRLPVPSHTQVYLQ
ncbi:hypothetical protein [Streptomyces sp. NPDC002952]|uniref:hypothetical protein n=1 Tax=Streptomyces sp. NPDC002952 TaxID=3364673 RepID=UPI0036CF3FB2